MKIGFLLLLALFGCSLPAIAEEQTSGPLPGYLKSLSCRVVTRAPEPGSPFTPLVEAALDTTSPRPEEHSFHVPVSDGRVLTAKVRHVYIKLPRQRFNVTLLLDGKPHMKINHIDLDIYAETALSGTIYALHCFAEHQ